MRVVHVDYQSGNVLSPGVVGLSDLGYTTLVYCLRIFNLEGDNALRFTAQMSSNTQLWSCQICGRLVQQPVTCPVCQAINYCGQSHRQRHWRDCHNDECPRMKQQMLRRHVRREGILPYCLNSCPDQLLCRTLVTSHSILLSKQSSRYNFELSVS